MPYFGPGFRGSRFVETDETGNGAMFNFTPFNKTLDSNGQIILTGITDAETCNAIGTVVGLSDNERGSLRVVSKSSTTITLRSEAGRRHAGKDVEGVVIGPNNL